MQRARSENPMNEAVLISLHDAIQNEEFSLFQIFIDDPNLMEIYKEKREQYGNSKENMDNPYLNLDDEEEEDERFETYKENIETITEELESRISNDTFLDLFLCHSEKENKENAKVLTDSIANISKYLEVEESQFIYSILPNILFTGELDARQILDLYKLLSKKYLEVRDFDTLDNLFSAFIDELFPDD